MPFSTSIRSQQVDPVGGKQEHADSALDQDGGVVCTVQNAPFLNGKARAEPVCSIFTLSVTIRNLFSKPSACGSSHRTRHGMGLMKKCTLRHVADG
jgi:hypothetical protein